MQTNSHPFVKCVQLIFRLLYTEWVGRNSHCKFLEVWQRIFASIGGLSWSQFPLRIFAGVHRLSWSHFPLRIIAGVYGMCWSHFKLRIMIGLMCLTNLPKWGESVINLLKWRESVINLPKLDESLTNLSKLAFCEWMQIWLQYVNE